MYIAFKDWPKNHNSWHFLQIKEEMGVQYHSIINNLFCLFWDLTFNKILSYVQRSNILFDIVLLCIKNNILSFDWFYLRKFWIIHIITVNNII